FWPHHADFRRIRPQNRVGTSKSIVPPLWGEKQRLPGKMQDAVQDNRQGIRPAGAGSGRFVPAQNFPAGEKIAPKFKNLVMLIRFLRVQISSKENPTMNEQIIFQDQLAKEIDALLAPYPDPMSRNDFRIACHIGTRTSLYLLQSE